MLCKSRARRKCAPAKKHPPQCIRHGRNSIAKVFPTGGTMEYIECVAFFPVTEHVNIRVHLTGRNMQEF
jgi:hypothetical protein